MLKKNEKKFLRSLAHDADPVVWIGQNGLTDNVLTEIDQALERHELLKIKVRVGEREEKDRVINQLCEQTKAELIKKIGNVVTVFRRNHKDPKITFAK